MSVNVTDLQLILDRFATATDGSKVDRSIEVDGYPPGSEVKFGLTTWMVVKTDRRGLWGIRVGDAIVVHEEEVS